MSKHILDRRRVPEIRRRRCGRRGRRIRRHDDPRQQPRLGDDPGDASARTRPRCCLQMTRQLYPHDRLGDIYYAEVVEGAGSRRPRRPPSWSSWSRTASPRSTRPSTCRSCSCRTGYQTEVLAAMETEPFFQTVRGHTVVALYNNKVLWTDFGYQGSSWQDGGYLMRGFQDVGWTHAARRRGQPAAVPGLREDNNHGDVRAQRRLRWW